MQAAVASNTEFAGNTFEILLSVMFSVTFGAMPFMSDHKIRLLMSILVTEIRITGEKVSGPVVADEAFFIGSGSGLRITTEGQDAVRRAGERDVARFASILKHLMRR